MRFAQHGHLPTFGPFQHKERIRCDEVHMQQTRRHASCAVDTCVCDQSAAYTTHYRIYQCSVQVRKNTFRVRCACVPDARGKCRITAFTWAKQSAPSWLNEAWSHRMGKGTVVRFAEQSRRRSSWSTGSAGTHAPVDEMIRHAIRHLPQQTHARRGPQTQGPQLEATVLSSRLSSHGCGPKNPAVPDTTEKRHCTWFRQSF